MKKYVVDFTNQAWKPIEAQVRFITIENKTPSNASQWLERLLDAIDTLEQKPDRHGVDEQQSLLHRTNVYRLVFERTYLVFYSIDQDRGRVNIVSFRHGAQEQK